MARPWRGHWHTGRAPALWRGLLADREHRGIDLLIADVGIDVVAAGKAGIAAEHEGVGVSVFPVAQCPMGQGQQSEPFAF